MTLLLGAHVPTTGGLTAAAANGRAIGADAIQIFTRNQVQWRSKPISADEAATFHEAVAESGVRMVVTHGSYLVNLASPRRDVLERSRDAFLAEARRCDALGIPYLIFHPGAHMGAGEEAGLRAVAESLDRVFDLAGDLSVMPVLEVTAGQGSYLGHSFEHLAAIRGRVARPDRLGVCLDTCHLLAAGHDIATPEGYEATLASFDRIVGFETLKVMHLNDAKKGLGSRLDRHAAIGQGSLGIETFRRIVNDPRFDGIPMVLETPGGLDEWKKEIALLRGLRTGAPS